MLSPNPHPNHERVTRITSATTDSARLSDEQLVERVCSTEFSREPYRLYKFLRDTRPVWYVERMDRWWVTLHEDVLQLLKQGDLFTVDN